MNAPRPFRPRRALALAILAMGLISLACAGCASASAPHPVSASADYRPVSLRVEKCYWNPHGQLAVVAQGGVWQLEVSDTPRASVWFVANVTHAAPYAQMGVVTFSQSLLIAGQPDTAHLAAAGFVEVPFREYAGASASPLAGVPLPPGTPGVVIHYEDLRSAQNFPDGLGYWPKFSVQEPGAPPIAVELVDDRRVATLRPTDLKNSAMTAVVVTSLALPVALFGVTVYALVADKPKAIPRVNLVEAAGTGVAAGYAALGRPTDNSSGY